MAGGFHWGVSATLLSIDVIENAFHLWSCTRSTDVNVRQFIAAQLILREWVEVTVPLQFLIVITFLWHVQPNYYDMLCDLTQDDFEATQALLAIDFVVEAIVAIIVQCSIRQM